MGVFANDKVILVDGQTFVFDMNEEPGDSYRVRLPHPEILNTLRVGDFLLLGEWGRERETDRMKEYAHTHTHTHGGE